MNAENLKQLAALLENVKLSDVMASPVKTIKESEPFSTAEELFVEHKIRHLPVVDKDGVLLGMLSQRDVYRAVAPRRFVDGTVEYREGIIVDKDGYYEKDSLNKYILKYVMQKNPETLSPEHSLGDAIHSMVKHKSGSVPIVNGAKKVVGIITRFDILKFADRVFMGKV